MPRTPAERAIRIEADRVGKRYGDTWAVRELSLCCFAGEIVCLLGPNGAGKTTTLEMLQGLRSVDAGRVSVLGVDPRSAGRRLRRRIGVTQQGTSGFFRLITVREAFEFFATLYGTAISAAAMAERVGLTTRLDTMYGSLSGGQRQRLLVGLALLNEPEVLFLDEPTTGLDPEGRRDIWAAIQRASNNGACVLMSTHNVEEAFNLSDRIGIVLGGRLCLCDAPVALSAGSGALSRIDLFVAGRDVPLELQRVPGVQRVQHEDTTGAILLFTLTPERVIHALANVWDGFDGQVRYVIHRPSCEDTYFALADRLRAQHPAVGVA